MKILYVLLLLSALGHAQTVRAFIPLQWTVEGKEIEIEHTQLVEAHKGDFLLVKIDCPEDLFCAQPEYVLGSLANPRFELPEITTYFDSGSEHILFGDVMNYDSNVAFYIPTDVGGSFKATVLIIGD